MTASRRVGFRNLMAPAVPGIVWALMLVLVLAGCSRQSEDWRSAQTADTVESYEQFLQRHPDSAHATQARARVEQLAEDHDWQSASTADAVAAYQQFLAQHPEGKWAQEARIRIENLNIAVAPGLISAPAPAAPATAVETESLAPATAAPDVAGFAIQLGAYSTQAAADAHWKKVIVQFEPELGPLSHKVISARSASGVVYRLRATVPNEPRARELCARLKSKSQSCVVVLP